MNLTINFEAICQIFRQAAREKRDFLFEYEVYDLIRHMGAETPPRLYLLQKSARLDKEKLLAIPGDKIVIKVVSPYILHKSDAGGVAIVPKEPEQILSAVRRMQYEVPEKLAGLIEHTPEYGPPKYRELKGDALISAISEDITGFILCQFIPAASNEIGNELLVSIRRTREFGMVINAGLGGTGTELYAKHFKKGQAVVAASTEMTDGSSFFKLFQETISYKKLTGLMRGQKRVVTDDQLLECFSSFIVLANHFSPSNPESPFVIEELEVNPFSFTNYLMVPLDGLCRFSLPRKQPVSRPLNKIDKLLHPASIGVVGVSAKEMNIGRIIINNIVANGFDPSKVVVFHPEVDQIDGIAALSDLNALEKKLDLLVIAVSAANTPELIGQVIDNALAESIIIIPSGLGEKKGKEYLKEKIQKRIRAERIKSGDGPVFLGGNSLGVLSHPGKFDTMFIPDTKLPKQRGDYVRNSAFISQSGAYMITRMSKLSFLNPAYAISIGNQIDLTAGDILKFMNTLDDIKILAFYIEGFADLDGLEFTRAARQAVQNGKQIIFYKAGRTPEGETAMSGHTASVAGDYMVCESCISQSGAIVAKTFTSFEGLLLLDCSLQHKKVTGNRLAAISNAGYESVGIADNILGEDYALELADFAESTRKRLKSILKAEKLDTLIDVKNPLDVSPMATEQVYESIIDALLEDPNIDAVVAAIVPLTPLLQTLPKEIVSKPSFSSEKSIVKRIARLALKSSKPLVMVIDSGPLYDPLAAALEEGGLPVFRSADQAVWVLGKYIQGRLRVEEIKAERSQK